MAAMSDVSQSIAQSMKVPEELVLRSARARAEASGSSVDDVLSAWSGGGSVSSAAPAAAAPIETSAPAEVVAETSTEVPIAETPQPAVTQAAVSVVVLEEPEEPIVAPPIRDRLLFGAKLGAMAGLMFGIFAALVSTRFALTRIAPAFDGEALRASSLIAPPNVVLYVTILTTLFGGLLAGAASAIPAWFDRDFSIRSRRASLTVVGAAVGAVAGLVGSGVLIGAGSTIEPVLPEDPVMVAMSPVASSLLLVVIMIIVGVAVSAAVQMMALPAGLTEDEEAESDVIKHRLVTSYFMPILVILAIASFVLPFAWLLLTFHASAPLIAIVAAGGVLTFAGLAASKPNGSISAGEFAVAAVGIGVVLLFVALVTNAVSGGDSEHSETEQPAGDHAVVQVWV